MVCLAVGLIAVVASLALSVVAQQSGGGEQFDELIGRGDRFKRQDEYAFALTAYEGALRAAERSNNHQDMARAHLGQGEIFVVQVKFSHALEALQQSLKLNEAIGDTRGAAHANNQLGYVYYRLYYYDSAERHLEKALKGFQSIGDESGMASVLNHLGRNHISQGETPAYVAKALDYYTRSITLGEASGNDDAVASALSNLGNLHLQQEHLNREGKFYRQPEIERAEAIYRQALARYEASGNRRGQGIVWGNLSRTFFNAPGAEARRKAIEYAARSVRLFEAIGDDDDLWEAYWNLGKAHSGKNRNLYDVEPALPFFAEAIKIIERMRQTADGDDLTLQRYFRGQTAPYQSMVGSLIDLNRIEEALGYVQRGKGRVLLDILARAQASQSSQTGKREHEREQSINDKLTRLNDLITRESQRTKPRRQYLAELKSKRQGSRQALLDFQAQAVSAQPEMRAATAEMRPLNLEEAAALLPGKESAILEYFGNDLFVLTRAEEAKDGQATGFTLKAYKIDRNFDEVEWRNRIAAFRRQLAGRDNSFHSPVRAFYDALIAPAREQLRGKTSLIIMPDGALWNVPFQILLDKENRYLIETAAISYAPSLTVLREMRGARKPTESTQGKSSSDEEGSLLALGNPAVRGATVGRVRERFRDVRLEPLPEAEREVRRIGELYRRRGSKVLIGNQAREELLKDEAARYDVLHLATHAIVSDENPMYSSLVLSQSGKNLEGGEDGLLEAWEIMRLKLRARMVVLSACETANGHASEGEGMMGLSWAFLAAGVPALVVSQWKVESASTSELMIEFHRLLRQSPPDGQPPLTKAEALRQASLTLLKRARSPHPFYWAGFVVVGDGG